MSGTNGTPKNYKDDKAEEKRMDKSFAEFAVLLAKGKATWFNLDDEEDKNKFIDLKNSISATTKLWFNVLPWTDYDDYAAGSITLVDNPGPHSDDTRNLYCVTFKFDQYQDYAELDPLTDSKNKILNKMFTGTYAQVIEKLKELMKTAKIYKFKYA